MNVSVVVPSNRDHVETTKHIPEEIDDVQVVRENGLNRARNAGVRNAKHSVVALLDDDLAFDADWIPQQVERLGVDGDVLTARGTGILPKVDWPDGFEPGMGRAIFFTKEVWKRAGGFPTPCSHGGDTVFLMRAYRAGYDVVGIDHEFDHLDDDVDTYDTTDNVKWLWRIFKSNPRLVGPRVPDILREAIR